MLTLEVSLLRQAYEATDPTSGGAEWPPHPYRLFAALVAAAGAGRTPQQAEALRWLEDQPPPLVTASPATLAAGPTRYLPVDDPVRAGAADALVGRRAPLSQPVALPAVPRVGFTWHAAPPARLHAALVGLAAEVTYLGRSSSPVRVRVTDAAPGDEGLQPWSPDAPGVVGERRRLRVPYPGLLAALDARFADVDLVVRPVTAGYGLAAPARDPAAAPGGVEGPFDPDVVVFRRVGGPQVPIERTLTVTSLFRQALLQRLGQQCPAVFTGHGPVTGPAGHAAYLPVPRVGDPHASGQLLGVMIALPRGYRAADLAWLASAPTRLTLGARLGVWHLEPVLPVEHGSAGGPWALQPARWTWPAAVWRSATPVVLPFAGGGRRLWKEAVRGVRRACVKAGYPEPLEVDVAPVSWVRGGGHAARFVTSRYGSADPRRAAVHAWVRFPVPVHGPVLLGPLRFFGLGLFVPDPAAGEAAA